MSKGIRLGKRAGAVFVMRDKPIHQKMFPQNYLKLEVQSVKELFLLGESFISFGSSCGSVYGWPFLFAVLQTL